MHHLRWASEQQLDLRWNEFVVGPFSNTNALFKSTARAIATTHSVEVTASMLMREVDMSLETNLEKIMAHLTRYRNGVTTFINNAFRHVKAYEDGASFLDYMERSKNIAIRDFKNLSRSPLVSDLKRYYAGLDDVFSGHVVAIQTCFDQLKTRYEIEMENRKSHLSM